MNAAFGSVIGASEAERRDLFLGTAARLGTAVQLVEKDYWVCWTLDALFNGLSDGGPRLLFKGGTSLSKSFGLISRFSEDIDVTVFRDDLGVGASVEELEAMTRKKRGARLDAIKAACQAYIAGEMRAGLADIIGSLVRNAGLTDSRFRVELDPDDPDGQSLLLWYLTVVARPEDYVRSAQALGGDGSDPGSRLRGDVRDDLRRSSGVR